MVPVPPEYVNRGSEVPCQHSVISLKRKPLYVWADRPAFAGQGGCSLVDSWSKVCD